MRDNHYNSLLQELKQFRQVSGLDVMNYPGGRMLPDEDLMRDPAALADTIGRMREQLEEIKAERDALAVQLAEVTDER